MPDFRNGYSRGLFDISEVGKMNPRVEPADKKGRFLFPTMADNLFVECDDAFFNLPM
jgi:hypothetical protein